MLRGRGCFSPWTGSCTSRTGSLPSLRPKRFDTRFFVACVPPGQTAIHDDYETVETVWIRPHEALDRNDAGEFDLIFPTVKNLEAISRFSTSEALIEAAAAVEHVPAVLPRVISDGHGARIVLPGDPDYEHAVGTWVPTPESDLSPAQVQARSGACRATGG